VLSMAVTDTVIKDVDAILNDGTFSAASKRLYGSVITKILDKSKSIQVLKDTNEEINKEYPEGNIGVPETTEILEKHMILNGFILPKDNITNDGTSGGTNDGTSGDNTPVWVSEIRDDQHESVFDQSQIKSVTIELNNDGELGYLLKKKWMELPQKWSKFRGQTGNILARTGPGSRTGWYWRGK